MRTASGCLAPGDMFPRKALLLLQLTGASSHSKEDDSQIRFLSKSSRAIGMVTCMLDAGPSAPSAALFVFLPQSLRRPWKSKWSCRGDCAAHMSMKRCAVVVLAFWSDAIPVP